MANHKKSKPGKKAIKEDRPHVLTLNELAHQPDEPDSGKIPEEYNAYKKMEPAFYVDSKQEPEVKLIKEKISGTRSTWKLSINTKTKISRHLPVLNAESIDRKKISIKKSQRVTESFRPAWSGIQYLPKILPHRSPFRDIKKRKTNWLTEDPVMKFLNYDPNEALTQSYPWCCIGKVDSGSDFGLSGGGTGVLVGPNLLLTASHVHQWHQPGWWMRFRPGFRENEFRAESYVSQVRGYLPETGPTGYDYVICQLYNPLGKMLGWMGSQNFGNEDDYYDNRWITVGYPTIFFNGQRPKVHFDVEIVDIDNDDPGLELETSYGVAIGGGFSGGPLWNYVDNEPRVIGIRSGYENDGWDPVRNVYSGGHALVELVKYGLANFH